MLRHKLRLRYFNNDNVITIESIVNAQNNVYVIFYAANNEKGKSMDGEAEKEMAERLKRYVKAELKRVDVGYEELAARLTDMGLKETKATIGNKLNRGAFSAIFMIAVMKVIGREVIPLSEF